MSDSKTISTNEPMDTEPGGENTQYESQKTFTAPPTKPNVTSQFRDEEGTVHLPTHRKFHAGDIKKKGGEGSHGEGEGIVKRDEDGTAHLPTHNKVRMGDLGKKGEEKGEGIVKRDEDGTAHLPTHNKVRMGKKGDDEEKSLDDRGKMGYGEGSGVGA